MTNQEKDGTASAPSAAIYSKPVLAVYDIAVLGISNAWVWRCPTRTILQHYNTYVSARHLDVGVGTGYFLDHCLFPVRDPALTLMDLNPNSLAVAARRVWRYHPATLLADVTTPFQPPTAPFDSIGINYLLHCLAGPMRRKGALLGHLATLLNAGGVLFGTTILGRGIAHGVPARALLRLYNALDVFGNRDDDADALTEALRTHFRSVNVRVIGSVASFDARV